MHYRLAPRVLAACSSLLLAACGPSVPHDAGRDADASGAACSTAIVLSAVASPSPYTVVTLRGSATGASQVLITSSSSPNPVAVTVDLYGRFCADVAVAVPSAETFTLQALCGNGATSPATATAMVTSTASAPLVANATTCAGTAPPTCDGGVCSGD